MFDNVPSDALIGFVEQIGLAVVVGLMFHWLNTAYVIASLLSAVTASLLFQALVYLHEGHFNKFALVGFIFGTLYSFIASLVIGLPFLIYRIRHPKSQST